MRIALLFLLVGVASARDIGEWVVPRQRKAEALARAEDYVGAAKVYGKAIAKAHKARDCVSEGYLHAAMLASFSQVWEWEAGPDGTGRGELRAVLHALMKELKPERSAAFLSAHTLAYQLVMRATWKGDFKYVPDATAVIDEYVDDGDDLNKCSATMLRYARGMMALRQKKLGDGIASLEKALGTIVKEGWSDLAIFASTELAAAYLKKGNPGGAKRAIDATASTFSARADAALVDMWSRLVKARLSKASADVLAAHTKIVKAARPPMPPTGKGETGKHGGRHRTALLGRILPSHSARKPLMTAERTGKGFELRQRFDKRFKFTQPYLHGVRFKGNQGLTLAFFGYATGTAKFDPTGLKADPDDQIWPSPFATLYHLARGETYGVTKHGIVKIDD